MNQYVAVSSRPQDGGRQNNFYNYSNFNRYQQNDVVQNVYQPEVCRNELAEIRQEESRIKYGGEAPNDFIQNEENMELDRNEDEDESYHDRNQEDSSYSKGNKPQTQQKKKRGRKRKNREGGDGSTESDPEMLNYDKFIKKVSKKGTRVHMNIRMFAVRTSMP